ncbi:hypothetical protein [Salinivibrio sp. MA427]|uniref:hypothetical protein n=1 Tax=Salinivibrio sp. MA427 TaxID=1909455 RepID=UPI0018FE35B5|nr:hypothetical protein [Salinivibrio sp. MA427]
MPITEVSCVHSQLHCPRYVTVCLFLVGMMAAWLLAVHVSLPLCARAFLMLHVVRELIHFQHRLVESTGCVTVYFDDWIRLPSGERQPITCIWATPWLMMLKAQSDARCLYLWRYGLPDYHFRLLYRHYCQPKQDSL